MTRGKQKFASLWFDVKQETEDGWRITDNKKREKSSVIHHPSSIRGFTLIELSIVLVIIGLIVGGVLTGRDLIAAAEIRSQISQIQNYNTAVRTFQLKYNALPGDILPSNAASFGFTPTRSGSAGYGDGNENIGSRHGTTDACCVLGETAWFWTDLSINSGLIAQNLNAAIAGDTYSSSFTGSTISTLLPAAKIAGNYVTVYYDPTLVGNYFSLMSFNGGQIDTAGQINNNTGVGVGLTVNQAYALDSKIDDGFPQTGSVVARYQQAQIGTLAVAWAKGGGAVGASDTSATAASSTTCYDNGNVAGTQKYSTGTNSGNGMNCALSFKFQ